MYHVLEVGVLHHQPQREKSTDPIRSAVTDERVNDQITEVTGCGVAIAVRKGSRKTLW